uniref:Uncharacterized protein n=1 Tax=Corvus moneduloides TaxID=1196302 RepID=A0A8C3EC95_CORMO
MAVALLLSIVMVIIGKELFKTSCVDSSLVCFPVGSSCSLPRAVACWLQRGRRLCSGTSDRSCSSAFSGWLATAKSKGKVMFIPWECLRQPSSLYQPLR